jgi:hypothetical protein
VKRILKQFVQAINQQVLPNVVCFPMTAADRREVERQYFAIARMPSVIGLNSNDQY